MVDAAVRDWAKSLQLVVREKCPQIAFERTLKFDFIWSTSSAPGNIPTHVSRSVVNEIENNYMHSWPLLL